MRSGKGSFDGPFPVDAWAAVPDGGSGAWRSLIRLRGASCPVFLGLFRLRPVWPVHPICAGLFRGGARAFRDGLSALAWLVCPVFPLLIRLSRFSPGPLFPRHAFAILRPALSSPCRLVRPRLGPPPSPRSSFSVPSSGLTSRPFRVPSRPRVSPRGRSRAPSRPVRLSPGLAPPWPSRPYRPGYFIIYRCRVSRLGGRGVVPRSGRLCIRVVPSDLRFI